MLDGKEWVSVSSKIGFAGSRLKVRVDEVVRPDGSTDTYEYVDKKDFAVIIPRASDGSLHLVEQYRYPVRSRSWEFPQGECGMDSSLLECAKRELREELGLTAGNWQSLGKLWLAVGNSNQEFEVFLAEGLSSGRQDLDPSEADLIGGRFSEDKVSEMISSGLVRSSISVAALYLLWSAAVRVPTH